MKEGEGTREIKVRAWDKTKNEMIYFNIPDNLYELAQIWDCAIIMQYTGLKDKGGKEVYERDIVKCSISKTQHYKGIIQFEYGQFFIQTFWYRFNPIGRWDLQKAPLSGKTNTKLDIRCDIDKVIGNIYENPELLKEQPK